MHRDGPMPIRAHHQFDWEAQAPDPGQAGLHQVPNDGDKLYTRLTQAVEGQRDGLEAYG